MIFTAPGPVGEGLNPSDRVAQGARAQAILDSDVFRIAEERVGREYVFYMLDSTTVEEREEARAVILGLGALRKQLQVIVDDGEMAKAGR